LDALYQKATLSIYPSLFEGFGFPPLEAQRYGVPVITGFHSSLQEVLKDSVLYTDVLDAHALTRAMQSILTDQKLRSNLIGKGLENIKRFSWEQTASRIIDACERALRV
jgi:glycosyltransferase involved in cell wall biosynthesis